MLTELRIRNFVIIDALALPLARGFNVLSGETGAGKSIIVGALGLLLGERASTEVIRTGADRATVEGTFDVAGRDDLAAVLDARGIELDEAHTVVLKREVASGGRNRAWANGTPVTAGVLAEIGRLLVNLHGQHEAQTLLDAESQRRTLDAFAGAQGEAERTRAAAQALDLVRREVRELVARRAEAERRADYLRHVAKEIEDAKLVAGEDERLEEEARRLEHADELRTLASGAAGLLDGGEDSVQEQLAAVHRALGNLERIDPALARLSELYDSAFYALEELSRELADYERSVELDPERLQEVQRRRDLLYRLTKKYGPTLADVVEQGRRARERRRAVARDARAQDHPRAARPRAHARLRRGRRRDRRARGPPGRGDDAARRGRPPGVRDLAPPAARGAGAPPHRGEQGRARRRHDRRRARRRGRGARRRSRAHARRRFREPGEPRPRARAPRGRGAHGRRDAA